MPVLRKALAASAVLAAVCATLLFVGTANAAAVSSSSTTTTTTQTYTSFVNTGLQPPPPRTHSSIALGIIETLVILVLGGYFLFRVERQIRRGRSFRELGLLALGFAAGAVLSMAGLVVAWRVPFWYYANRDALIVNGPAYLFVLVIFAFSFLALRRKSLAST
jgi:hypothetical protein